MGQREKRGLFSAKNALAGGSFRAWRGEKSGGFCSKIAPRLGEFSGGWEGKLKRRVSKKSVQKGEKRGGAGVGEWAKNATKKDP